MIKIPSPPYRNNKQTQKLFFAVKGLQQHMTDEGWQLQEGMSEQGYLLTGRGLDYPVSDVRKALHEYNPGVVICQDKREWEGHTARQNTNLWTFQRMEELFNRNDIFKLTVLKDAHQKNAYHRVAATEIGAHAWIVYYHPDAVEKVAPYVRKKDLIRIYHSVNKDHIGKFPEHRPRGVLLAGALNRRVYPIRSLLMNNITRLKQHKIDFSTMRHPGYHTNGAVTPSFLRKLVHHKVVICTCSIYDYALRKIFEAVCCGCRVITDLPTWDKLPVIDDSLIRIDRGVGIPALAEVMKDAVDSYDKVYQESLALEAQEYYDYRASASRLDADIQRLRSKKV